MSSGAISCLISSMKTNTSLNEIEGMLKEPKFNEKNFITMMLDSLSTQPALKAEIFQVLSSIAFLYYEAFQVYWNQIFSVVLQHFIGTEATIRAQALKVVEEYTKSTIQYGTPEQGLFCLTIIVIINHNSTQ